MVFSNLLAFTTGNNLAFRLTSNRFYAYSALADTAGATANTEMLSDGRVRRVGSKRSLKKYISYPEDLADIQLPPAARFRMKGDEDGKYYLGWIAEEMAEANELLGLTDLDGVVENYSDRGILAVIAAKVKRIEEALGLI